MRGDLRSPDVRGRKTRAQPKQETKVLLHSQRSAGEKLTALFFEQEETEKTEGISSAASVTSCSIKSRPDMQVSQNFCLFA